MVKQRKLADVKLTNQLDCGSRGAARGVVYCDLPARVSKLEIVSAERAWIPRLLWSAMTASVVGFVTSLYTILKG